MALKCNYTLKARLLIVVGASIILAGLLAQLFGVRTTSSWSEESFLGKNEYLAVMLWSLTSKGEASIKVDGVRNVLYTVVMGNPLSLVMNSSAFGVRIESTQTNHDFRAGIFYASAKVSMDPLAVAFVASRFNKGNQTMSIQLSPSESIIFLLIPKKSSSTVHFDINFKVVGYERLSLTGSLAIGLVLILLES